jgi:inositol-polyphosphate multikinase
MPQWYGTITSADQQPSLSMIPGAQNQAQAVLSSLATSSATNGLSNTQNQTTPQERTWTPSGGRKLDTGISIVLENIADGFKRPNVLDVKLGRRLWADDAPPAKRVKLEAVSKETTSYPLGFRIAGMKVWVGYHDDQLVAENIEAAEFTDPYMTKYEGSEAPKGQVVEKNGYKRYDKWYGRTFTPDNVKEGFETFLTGAKAGKIDRSRLIASRILEELRAVKYALESEESRMYSSSILVIYEGDPDALEEALKYEENQKELEDAKSDSSGGTESLDIANEFDIAELGALQPVGIASEENGEAAGNIPGPLNFQVDPESLANIDDDDSFDDEEIPIKVHDFRLIDFAHATWTPGEGPDQNALMGIKNLITVMEELAGEKEKPESAT